LLWILFLEFQIDDYVEIKNWIERRIMIVTSQFFTFLIFFSIQGGADCLWSIIYFLDYRRFVRSFFLPDFEKKKLNLFEFICFVRDLMEYRLKILIFIRNGFDSLQRLNCAQDLKYLCFLSPSSSTSGYIKPQQFFPFTSHFQTCSKQIENPSKNPKFRLEIIFSWRNKKLCGKDFSLPASRLNYIIYDAPRPSSKLLFKKLNMGFSVSFFFKKKKTQVMVMLVWLSRKSFTVFTPIIEGGFFGRSRNKFLWEKSIWTQVFLSNSYKKSNFLFLKYGAKTSLNHFAKKSILNKKWITIISAEPTRPRQTRYQG
jgi:hypothetical protein